MTARSGIAAALGLVAVALFAWWIFTNADPAIGPAPDASVRPPTPAAAPITPAGIAHEPILSTRDPAARPEHDPAADARQGFRGVVVSAHGEPLAEVAVHLLESSLNDPLAMPWILQQRLPLGPLTSARTAADGTFAIGLPVAQDKLYELFFVDAAHAAVRLTNLRMRPDEWFDVGAVTMVPGITVTGRVSIEGSGLPVPAAVVSVEAGTSFVDAALRALPSGDRGLSALVDATGHFELRNTPRLGVVRLTAAAPGFARVVRPDVNLSAPGPLEVDFVLPPALTIQGRITDEQNRGVAGARVEAWPRQSWASPLVGVSERDGRFVVGTLAAGPYAVRVVARGFRTHAQPDVAAGGADLFVSLTQNGSVRLRVRLPTGAPVRNFHANLRRFYAERGGQIAFVADVPGQRVRLDDRTDFAEIDGIPDGTFVFQVASEGFATTLSPPFTIDQAVRRSDVDVVLTTGATLAGQVLDESGRPLAEATVTTEPDGAMMDSPTWRMLAGAVPDRITIATTNTDADGRFELPLLAFGDYQLQIRHPDTCWTREPGIRLTVPARQTLAPIRLLRGSVVTGRATIGGAIAPRMKIVLTSPSNRAGQPTDGFRLETLAEPDGRFRFPRRVPPGMYELRAAVVDTHDSPGGHFRHLRQLQRSAVGLAVTAGQDRIERDIDLPNDH